MTDLTPERREELARLAEEATEGPWVWDEDRTVLAWQADGENSCQSVIATTEDAPADAAFIATARTAVPALLAENASLRAALAAAEAERDEARAEAVPEGHARIGGRVMRLTLAGYVRFKSPDDVERGRVADLISKSTPGWVDPSDVAVYRAMAPLSRPDGEPEQ